MIDVAERWPIVRGSAHADFVTVVDTFAMLIEAGAERGAGVCAVVGNEVVLDICGGWADPGRTMPWTRPTLANVWSATKGVVAVAVTRLIADGRLDQRALVTDYWPEYGANGKGTTRVEWLLNHRAGIPGFSEPTPIETLYDWPATTAQLARAAPVWQPGTVTAYHAVTFGFLIGEVVRRATGRSLGELVRDELAGPLGIDVYLGLTDPTAPVAVIGRDPEPAGNDYARIAQSADATLAQRPGVFALDPLVANTVAWRASELGAANLHASAPALAALYGSIAAHDDDRILATEDVRTLLAEPDWQVDVLHQRQRAYRNGFLMSGGTGLYGPGAASFGHHGWGGSVGFADPDREVGFGYVTAQMGWSLDNDPRPDAVVRALYAVLDR